MPLILLSNIILNQKMKRPFIYLNCEINRYPTFYEKLKFRSRLLDILKKIKYEKTIKTKIILTVKKNKIFFISNFIFKSNNI